MPVQMGYGHKDTSGAGDKSSESEESLEGHMDNRMQIMVDYAKLPQSVKRRVNALKNILLESKKVESEFYREIFNLEKKYRERFVPLLDKRNAFIAGAIEPTDEESKWTCSQTDELVDNLIRQNLESQEDVKVEENSVVKGIPKFWLKVLLHAPVTAELIADHDHPILEHLNDIRVTYADDESDMSFSLNFRFSPNEYFSEHVLTKTYFFDNSLPPENPLLYDGPRIVRVQVTPITWKPSKNVTIKFVKKVKKHRNRKEVRTFTKPVKQDSFFNFFDPPVESLNDEDLDEDTMELLSQDFRIATFMRDVLLPQAVLFFTGEYEESDGEYDDDDDDDDDNLSSKDADEDVDDANDSHQHLRQRNKREAMKGPDEKPECKQS